MDHQATFPQMAPFFPGLKEDLPDGAAWAVEKVELITHNGTHLDAPYHFHPHDEHRHRPARNAPSRSTKSISNGASSPA